MHIFDLDHTLVRGSSGRHFIVTAISEGVLPRSVLLSLPIVFLRYRLGRLKPAHINRELPQLRGIRRDVLEEVAHLAYERSIAPALFPDAIAHIEALHRAGEETAIATSSVDIIVEPLAKRLGIDALISSSVEFDEDGRCTGRFLDLPTFGGTKQTKVLSFLEERGIAPEACAFYSDSIYDLPLLESVGTPIVVNPDILLARHAKKSGWEIKHFE